MLLRLALYAVAALVLALHAYASSRRAAWLGALVPALWLAGIGYFWAAGLMDDAVDTVMAMVGFSVLLWMWVQGRERHSRAARTGPAAARVAPPATPAAPLVP